MTWFNIMPRPICCFIVLLVTACHWDKSPEHDLAFLQTDSSFDHTEHIQPLPLIDEAFVSRFPHHPSSDAIFTTIAHIENIPDEAGTPEAYPESYSAPLGEAMLAYEPHSLPSDGTQALGVQEGRLIEPPPIPQLIAVDAPQLAFSLPIRMKTLCSGIGCEGGVNLIGEALMMIDFNLQKVVLNEFDVLNIEMMYRLSGEVVLPFADSGLQASTLAHAALTLTTPDTIIDSNDAATLIINEADIHAGLVKIEFHSSANDTSFIGSGITARDQLQ